MNRREFLQTSALGLAMPSLAFSEGVSHIISLSWDDGFRTSCLQIADIFESHGLQAGFNVIASGHMPDFEAPDDYILPELMGNFDDWNGLVKRGHEVMPHSWKHAWLNRLAEEEAKALIGRSIDYFVEHLDGFEPQKAVFNFPFNATSEALDAYTLSRVGALRAWGNGDINPMPASKPRILGCSSHGENNIDRWVKNKVKAFLQSDGGWLILNTHGLDGEGWGPMSSRYLDKLLGKLNKRDSVAVLPVAKALFG